MALTPMTDRPNPGIGRDPGAPQRTGSSGTPPVPGGGTDLPSASTLLADLRATFPWLDQVGFTPEFFQDLAASSASADEIVAKLRAAPQYKARFPGLWRPDGSIRMNEAQYLAREQDYRTILRQHGYDANYTNAQSLVGFFDNELDPNELQDRLQTYKQIRESSQSVKDTFYVYAGLNVTDDDLYQATVDPAAAQRLQDEYNARVAASTFDYQSWITRATERGLQRATETLTQLQRSGAMTGTAIQAVLRVDPTFARSIMDALYTNAGDATTAPLALNELISSFEYAAIGAAASNAGLQLPTKERVAMIRQAGIDRSKAASVYQQYGQAAGVLDDAVRRATGAGFDQTQFEDANFLGDANQAGRMSAGLAREQAAGQASGQFRFDQTREGRLVQGGLR